MTRYAVVSGVGWCEREIQVLFINYREALYTIYDNQFDIENLCTYRQQDKCVCAGSATGRQISLPP